jgi:hypothetical protein
LAPAERIRAIALRTRRSGPRPYQVCAIRHQEQPESEHRETPHENRAESPDLLVELAAPRRRR